MSPEARKWRDTNVQVIMAEGVSLAVARKRFGELASGSYIAGSAMAQGRFVSQLCQCVVNEHRPLDDEDWGWLYYRVRKLDQDGWLDQYRERFKDWQEGHGEDPEILLPPSA
jgi:hypothetical protein